MAKENSRGRGSGRAARPGGSRGGRGGRPPPPPSPAAAAGAAAKKPVPAHWPPQIEYLTTPVYAGISPRQRQLLQALPAGGTGSSAPAALSEIPPILRFGPSPLVEIRPIADPAHPACGQRGLFAAKALPAGSFVVPYLGVYHRGAASAHRDSDYDLWLDRAADVAVDAARAGNESRFVNDYRGTGKPRPNAEFREVWDPRRGERGVAVFVLPAGRQQQRRNLVASSNRSGPPPPLSGIAKGEEILVSYGKGFWEMRNKEQNVEVEPEPVVETAAEDASSSPSESAVATVADGLQALTVTKVQPR